MRELKYYPKSNVARQENLQLKPAKYVHVAVQFGSGEEARPPLCKDQKSLLQVKILLEHGPDLKAADQV